MTRTKTRTAPEFIDVAAIEAELENETSEDLKAEFWDCYNGAARLIARAGVSAKILRSRGDSLAGYPMRATFLRIGEGQLLPELFWQFIESPNLRLVEHLPKSAQEEIVANPVVAVAHSIPGGGWTKQMCDLRTARPEVVKIALSDEGVRPMDEQQAYIASQKPRPAVDPRQVVAEEPLTHRVTVKLTDSEFQALRIKAAEHSRTEREMARWFMTTAEVLKPLKKG